MEIETLKTRLQSITSKEYYKSANLHTHSVHSDGSVEFDTLVEQAKELGLKHFSICDHNTISGYKNTKYLHDPILIPAIEFDCFYGTTLLHIIGYGIDIYHSDINKICAKSKKETQYDIIRLFKSRHPKSTIEAIHSAGGLAVLAHPCCCSTIGLDGLVKKMVSFGLDGIEAYYPYNRHRGIIKFHPRLKAKKIGQKYNLILTGGTDEHGSLLG